MRSIEKAGRTVDEAVERALQELGVTRQEVEVEVLDEEPRALFGILGPTYALVRVTVKATPGQIATELVTDVLKAMQVDATAELAVEDQEQATINIKGQDLGVIIGRRGQTLGALQHLVGLITTRKTGLHKRVVLDAEDYRARREETLRSIARRAAERALETGEDVSLDPMPANERRIVHLALAEDPRVSTRSIGQEPMRRLVVSPKGGVPRQRRRPTAGRPPRRRTAPAQKPEEPPDFEEEPQPE